MGDGQERTEEATARKRTDARKKGTVARSQDLTNALVMAVLLMVLPMAISSLLTGFLNSVRTGTSRFPTDVSGSSLMTFSMNALRPVLPGLAMIVFAAMSVGLVTNFAQVGFIVSSEALMPNFNKINPLNGLKRMFSAQVMFEGGKATVKTVVFALVAYSAVKSQWNSVISLSTLSPVASMSILGGIARNVALKIVMVWAAVAGLDFFFQKKQTDKQLRMTKQEVKQEMKQAESSPEVRAARAQRRRKMAKGRMMDAVKTADVIVTNPTHYAIALKYEPGKTHAPVVIAKGMDFLAARIREEAKKNGVAIVPNPPLARALYKQCEVGDYVPREMFEAVAQVLAFVYRTLKKVPRRS